MDEHSTQSAQEAPHDVLAAEMFAVPAPDPILHHGPLVVPGDLTGSREPRDVLAAEEFAMPAPPEIPHHDLRERGTPWWQSVAVWTVLIFLLGLTLRRRRRALH